MKTLDLSMETLYFSLKVRRKTTRFETSEPRKTTRLKLPTGMFEEEPQVTRPWVHVTVLNE
jgi:hypothetical protein